MTAGTGVHGASGHNAVGAIQGTIVMPGSELPIVRIVVDGCPSANSEETNFARARRMLLRAFADNRWPGNAMFALTPGGFVKAPFPDTNDWDGESGWRSRPEDFSALLPHARTAVDEVLTPQVMDAARGRAEYLTLGVDLSDRSGKRKMDRGAHGTHAELVAIVEVARGEPVRWTGKSYPVSWQERTLVQELDLDSHLLRCGAERVLILGCHDLNMFSPRAEANMTAGSDRQRRSERMRKVARKFRPTMILHHPHSTDSPRIWSTAWSGARKVLSGQRDGRHVWASGIAYYNGGEARRGTLCGVLEATRCCHEDVVDIRVKSGV